MICNLIGGPFDGTQQTVSTVVMTIAKVGPVKSNDVGPGYAEYLYVQSGGDLETATFHFVKRRVWRAIYEGTRLRHIEVTD